jgi:phage gp46-like protein
MPGRDRVIDPLSKDYKADANGLREMTRTARTAIYHQLLGKKGQWMGDPDAGSEFHLLSRAKNPTTSPRVIRDIMTRALQGLIDEGRITVPTYEQERTIDRVTTSLVTIDQQSGETLDLVDLLPFVP